MCGIVGYIGDNQAQNVLLEGMRRLEYRGYDSAGIAILGSEIVCIKEHGIVDNLAKMIKTDLVGCVGIGHTRWATHGVPSIVNAHPHTDCRGDIYLVHNGIIENYVALKTMLERKGHVFVSETDTEVIAHLIEDFYRTEGDVETAFKMAIKKLIGAYGIVMIHRCEPDKIFVVKYGSPMVLGVGDGENIVASDLAAIIRYTKRVIYLEDGEIAIIKKDDYTICDARNNYVEKSIQKIDWDLDEIEKGGYAHFMLKEIYEQPISIQSALRGRFDDAESVVVFGGFNEVAEKLKNINNILIVACGTAYYAGLCGEYLFEDIAGIKAKAIIASEFRYRRMIVDDRTLVLVVSQSGETADTLSAVKEAKRKGCLTMGIVNVVGSSIAREVHAGIYNHSGPEISVASTKAFTSQISVMVLVAVYLARQREMTAIEAKNIFGELEMLPGKVAAILQKEPEIKSLVDKYRYAQNFAFLGRKYNYATALEGALKLKELSYIHAEGYPAGELKHGSIALIDDLFPTIGIVPQDGVYEKTFSNLMEVKARKGKIIVIATEGDEKIGALAEHVFSIPPTLDFLNPILATIPLQLFAYHMALIKGRNVDKPRNLAKSVVVE